MKKGKYLVFIILVGLVLFPVETFARNATAWVSQNGEKNPDIVYDNGENYQDYHITVNYEGKNHDAYCADFGLHMGGGNNAVGMTCEEISSSALAYVLNDPNASHEVKQLASRVIAQQLGLAQSSHVVTSSNATMDSVNQLINAANSNSGGTLTFTKTSGSGANVTYNVTSPTPIANVNFTCGSGCNVTGQSWNGTSGTVSVSATNGACSFTINAIYQGNAAQIANNSRVIYCTGASKIQGVTFTINGSGSSSSSGTNADATTGTVTQTFSGSIDPSSGGSYYKQYCDKEDEPDKCNEKTDIQIPTFCDNPNDQNISITAPKNVQYCILNGKDDAGNTYKMNDGQIKSDNPYCAVYCKEDYQMTMPGAQYSDSGRYFELHNTVVKATRTCYATNPKGNSDEPQMDIDQFIKDIIMKQKAVLKAKDAYEKAKKEKEQADNPRTHDAKACNKVVGINYEAESTDYTGYEYDNPNCNLKTGVCQINTRTRTTDSYKWGTFGSEHRGQPDPITGHRPCDPSSTTTPRPDFEGALANAESALINAQNDLKKTIEHMEDCYSWVNNLCMDTIVNFDYNEQYSTNINYQLVSGGGTFTGSNATYGTNKKIDKEYTANQSGSLKDYNYIYCDANTCNHSNLAKQISTLNENYYYRKIEVNGSAEYANVQEFQTNYPHGTIDTVTDPSALRYNYSYLGAVFPIALNTPMGVYKWTLNFSQLGQYNDTQGCRNGRLDDVVKAQGKSIGAGVEYVCVYVVDCPDCDYECVGEGCLIPDEPKCPECDVFCEFCIFDGDGFTFDYRMIGNEPNPNDRDMGANWTSEKGQQVLEEIIKMGENIYIEAQYIYEMTPEQMKATRDYNKKMKNYVSEDLNFHDVGNVRNAYGTSSYLDNGQKNGFFTEKKRNKEWTQWNNVGNNMGPALS